MKKKKKNVLQHFLKCLECTCCSLLLALRNSQHLALSLKIAFEKKCVYIGWREYPYAAKAAAAAANSRNLFIFNQCTPRPPLIAWSLIWLAAWPATFVVCPRSACHWNIYELCPSIGHYFGPGWSTGGKINVDPVGRGKDGSRLACCLVGWLAS